MWAKIPAATASIACAACIAAASVAVPAMNSGSNDLKDTIAAQVNLTAIDFTPLLGLGSLDGIPAWLEFFSTGNVDAFVPVEDDPTTPEDESWAGYDALSALAAWRDGSLGDIDAFSAVPDLLNGDITALDAFNAIPTYEKIASGDATVDDLKGLDSVNGVVAWNDFINSGGDLSAFEPVDDDPATPDIDESKPGYDALSGAASWQRFAQSGNVEELAGIDAFSAIPNWKQFIEGGGDVSEDGLGGIDAFSALPALKEVADSATETEAVSADNTSARVATESTDTSAQTSTPGTTLKQLSQTITQSLPRANVQAPAAPAAEEPKASTSTSSTKTKQAAAEEPTGTSKGGGSYSGSFKPEPIVLFGSGKGNGADNGIRGWGEGLKKLGIGGGDTESAGGESGGEGAE